MSETNGNGNGVGILSKWGALMLAAGAMFWQAASQWGGRDAVVSATLEGLNSRLSQHAARMVDLQQQFSEADRGLVEQIVSARDATQKNADAVLRLVTTMEVYSQDRARLIADNTAARIELHQKLDGIQREIQSLRERVIVFSGEDRGDNQGRRP